MTVTGIDDTTLHHALTGDRHALHDVLTRTQPYLRARITNWLPRHERGALEDILQETFISLIRAIPGLTTPMPTGQWCTLAATIAYRRTADHVRRPRHETPVEIHPDDVATRVTPERIAIARDALDRIARTTNRLGHRQRSVIQLRALEWPSTDIATELGLTDTAVRVSLHRGRAALAEAVTVWRRPATS